MMMEEISHFNMKIKSFNHLQLATPINYIGHAQSRAGRCKDFKMKKLAGFIFLLLQFSVGSHQAFAAEAYQEPAPITPEYVETTDEFGNAKILKRDSSSQTTISPLVCIYFSGTASGGAVPVSGFVVGYGPYTSSCAGVHSFSSLTSSPSGAVLQMRLEKQVGSSWSLVASGPSITYSGATGTYRMLVVNTGVSIPATSWSAKYKIPN